jgi:hypothetical protein
MERTPQTKYAIGLLSVLFLGCAGRAANPVIVYQHGDTSRSCETLERELELIETDILELLPQTDKADQNTKLGVAGVFLLVPFFFMDLSKSEQIEVNALTKRYNHLIEIAETKGCRLERQALPEFKQTDY